MATLDEITERIASALATGIDLGKAVKLDLKGEGFIHIAGQAVSNDDKPADLVVTVSRKDLEAIGKGELDAMRAVMSGRLRVSDMGLAMTMQPQIAALFSKAV